MVMKYFPDRNEHGWVPYLWLIFLAFLVFQPAYEHASPQKWVLTLLGVLLFLVVYFALYQSKGRKRLIMIAAIAALGVIYAPYNGGSSTFFIYASALIPFATESTTEA